MSDRIVDLFAEDRAHEEFLRALIGRLAESEGTRLDLRVRSARGGHGRALEEFRLYQRSVDKGVTGRPHLVVVAIDANCRRFNQARRDIQGQVVPSFEGRVVLACPDPHIERWYMADPVSFQQIVGRQPKAEPNKCERGRYKRLLLDAIRAGGHTPTLGGIEFAPDLVGAMDLYRAGKLEPSLGALLDDLRASLKSGNLGG